MSFQEKSTWIQFVCIALVYGSYFLSIVERVQTLPVEDIGYQATMFATVGALVVLMIVAYIVVSIVSRDKDDSADERDRAINRQGEYIGGFVLGAGVLLAMGQAMLEMHQFWIANTLLAAMVLSELVSCACKIALYRWGQLSW